ncbi:beta-N-acetylhexosaminidase [Rhodoblastus acidophilus]|nr:beta-N-acetylhexosaminidase [Rhodoblastus acidophilus]PPQ36375.1 beta-N-acetylhexosaminidase [Rhodoblastus acidophilus]RAI19755.1 beta-N-acetylhexosaminidase [Rhodoblastus acidophilus]
MMFKAFIAGCAGPALSDEERAFFADARPWGLILFRRNVESPAQVAALTAAFRAVVGEDAAVLVDQEGGRVQRLREPHWPSYPAAARLGALPDAERLIELSARLMAADLLALGVDVDCLPVLDTPIEGAHDVIGDRAYARAPDEVARLGAAAARGLMRGGVMPVMKHIPGHGRACADSHLELPVVSAGRAELARDFAPFQANAGLPAAMTAHVVYEALDPTAPATQSPLVVQDIVRGNIGFDGLLMTDDLSMKALTGSFAERTRKCFAAGLDLALHCNGDLAEAREVAEAAPDLAGKALDRVQAARAAVARERARGLQHFDAEEARRTLAAALA